MKSREDDAPSAEQRTGRDDDGWGIDAHEDRWRWRASIKRRPLTRRIYRSLVALVGGAVVALGLVTIPAPGPGWAVVFVGLAILASEFEPADRLLTFAKRQVRRWTGWIGQQAWWVRALVVLATLAVLLAIFWGYLHLAGVPAWLPDLARTPLLSFPGLG